MQDRHGEDPLSVLTDGSLAAALVRVQRVLERFMWDLEDAREEAQLAVGALAELATLLSSGGTAGARLASPRVRRSPEELRLMRAEAEAGVASMDLTFRSDGSATVRVNGRPPFTLTPKLAALLDILAAPGRDAGDGLVGWRTRAEVAAALSKRTGRSMSPTGVTQSIHVLRRTFRTAGENWLLFQKHSRLGVRFALRVM